MNINKKFPYHQNNEKKPNYYSLNKSSSPAAPDRARRLSTIIYWSSLGFAVLLFIWIISVSRSPSILFNNEKIDYLNNSWTISCQGETFIANLPFDKNTPAGEITVFETVLPHKSSTKNERYDSILLRASHSYVRLYLEDTLLYEFGYDQSIPFSDAPGNGSLIIRLPDGFEGKTLRIEKIGYYDNYSALLKYVKIGTKSSLVFEVFREILPTLLINFSIILISLCMLFSSFFFQRNKLGCQLRYLSIFSIIASLWLILESDGAQFFIGNPLIVSNAVFILFSLIPLSFVRFILTFECFKESRTMKLAQYISFSGLLFVHALQLFRIANYFETIFITHIVIIIIALCILCKYIQLKLQKKFFVDKHIFASFFVLASFTLMDVIRFYVVPSIHPTLFSQIGVLIYFLILCFFAVKKVISDNESASNKILYERIAYQDILTGLPNRNAFEREMEYYRSNPSYCPVISVMDMNELKKINDTFGHAKGDEALCLIADAIREYFQEDAHAFRIGGDEFCVILRELPDVSLDTRIDELRKHIHTTASGKKLSLSLAAGWCQKDDTMDLNAVFQKADSNMYEDKKRMKGLE